MSNSNEIRIYYPKNIQEALFHLRTVTDLSIAAGYTGINFEDSPAFLTFPQSILNVRDIAEFNQITKTERFIEFGAAVTLSRILEIDFKRIPKALHDAILSVGNLPVRNMATIGGNVCTQTMKMTLYAPLLALDAKLEIRTGTEKNRLSVDKKQLSSGITNIPITQFTEIKPGTFLSKIRISLEDWSIDIFKRVGPKTIINSLSASFVFLANIQKNVLFDLRIAYCGVFCFRNKELENTLIGNKLPLSAKTIQNFIEQTLKYFDEMIENADIQYNPILRAQFCNLLEDSLSKLS